MLEHTGHYFLPIDQADPFEAIVTAICGDETKINLLSRNADLASFSAC